MKLIATMILLLFVLASCTKTYLTSVEGTVINFGNKEPIDSVLVSSKDGVANTSSWGMSGSTSSDAGGIIYTNSNGGFKIIIEGEFVPYVGFSKKGYTYEYIVGGAVIGIHPFERGKEHTNVVIEMKSVAGYKPVLASKSPTFETDTLVFENLSVDYRYMWDKFEHEANEPYYLYRKGPFDMSKHWSDGYTVGDVYKPYRLTLKRNGTKLITLDSVYIEGHTTFTDTLFY